MNERLQRIGAIVTADVRIRFRRASTLVIFLLLSGLAYVWIPDPASGSTLIVIAGRRALYNSAAIGVGTASLATIFVGLTGFYVVSNAIRKDVTSRCGSVIASTTMRGSEYLFGKFAGNAIFLATFTCGFMLTSMAMLLIRGEAPLQPLIFMWQYVLLVPPSIMFVSALAVFFESVPLLSGKFGDVAYFFLWAMSLASVAALIEKGRDPGLAAYFDFTGFGFLLDSMHSSLHTSNMSIGHTTFDKSKGVFIYQGLDLTRRWLMPRVVATVAPVLLVIAAVPFFHRFDPARVKRTGERGGRKWLSRISSLGKPLARLAWRLAPPGGSSLAGAAWTDALLAIAVSPLIILVAAALAIAALLAPPSGVMPIAMLAAAVLIADIACRDKRSGTLGFIFTAPRLRSRLVWWKFASSAITAMLILFVPCVRLVAARPSSLPYVAIGVAFLVAFATMLGIVSANPKTFLVLFLTFWYIVVNDSGHIAALDFAGWYGRATPAVLFGYAALSIAALTAAEVFHRADLLRNW
ncbi:MAG TPA: hypothetical protein VF980_20840 [Thermoanaerobaculia bacterium]